MLTCLDDRWQGWGEGQAMDTPERASEFFGAMVDEYDGLIRRAVPRYDEMIERLVFYLAGMANGWPGGCKGGRNRGPGPGARLLELGTGTGNLTLRLATQFPHGPIVSVDASQEMLDVTASRLSATERPHAGAAPVTFRCARFEDLDFEPKTFQAVVSCISLHHVIEKAPLFGRMAGWLKPGGCLVVADQMAGADERLHKLNWEVWLEFCRRPGHCTPVEIQSLIDHSVAHDHYEPVASHLDWLQDAGLRGVDCVWRSGMWGIVVGTAG